MLRSLLKAEGADHISLADAGVARWLRWNGALSWWPARRPAPAGCRAPRV